jgi:hypothetical protein
MERHIARWAYWLGVVCLVISFAWRVVQLWIGPVRGINLAPMTLYKGSLLLFVAAIATSICTWMEGQRPQKADRTLRAGQP